MKQHAPVVADPRPELSPRQLQTGSTLRSTHEEQRSRVELCVCGQSSSSLPARPITSPTPECGSSTLNKGSPHEPPIPSEHLRPERDQGTASPSRGPPAKQPPLGADIPDFVSMTSGKLRRKQAAAITRHGVPKQRFKLRPLVMEPKDKLLDGYVMLGACNVDDAEHVEVLPYPTTSNLCALSSVPIASCLADGSRTFRPATLHTALQQRAAVHRRSS